MSLLFGALGGLGEAGMQIGMANQKAWAEMEMEEKRQASAMEREKSLMRLKMDLETDAKNAPLNRLGEKTKEMASKEVPLEAEPVNALIGFKPGEDGKQTRGMVGDIASLKRPKGFDGWTPEDQSAYTAQINEQIKTEESRAKEKVAGQTRKPTSSEALDSAVEWARANDLPAVAAYEAQIGNAERAERRIDSNDRKTDAQTAAENARTAARDRKADSDEAFRQRMEERKQAESEFNNRRNAENQTRAELQSQRAAITNLMTSTERELERTSALAKDLTLSDAERAAFQSRVTSLQRDLGRYRKGLEGFGGDALKPSTSDAQSVKQDVTVDGKVIGQAATLEEAKKMIADYKAGANKAGPAKPEPKPLIDSPPYVPPAESIAGRAAAERAAKFATQAQDKASSDAADGAKAAAAKSAALAAIASKDPQEAERVQSMPGYGLMDAGTKAALFKLINGR